MARSKESYQLAADNANITKWSKVISNSNDGKHVFEVLGIQESVWNEYEPKAKLNAIGEWRKNNPNIRLPHNKKQEVEIDIKPFAFDLINPDVSPEEKEKAMQNITLILEYENAKTAFNEASERLNKAKADYESAKTKFNECKKKISKK